MTMSARTIRCGSSTHSSMGLTLRRRDLLDVEPKETGRPGYAPADLLKLYIYGYLNRVRSSRRLEAETHRNIEVIWLLRHLKPDFKTIADFRRDNRNAFRQVFRQFVLLCRQLDLFGRELLAVDGTRIKAVNNKDRNFTRASLAEFIKPADATLDDYLQRLDKSDAAEQAARRLAGQEPGREDRRDPRSAATRYKAMLAELDRTGEDQISLTDPDSRAMAAHTHVAVGYNAQIAVDAKHKLIVEQQVTNQVVDMGLLTQTAEPAKEIVTRGSYGIIQLGGVLFSDHAGASAHGRALLTIAAQLNDSTATAARNAATPQGAPFDCCRNVSEISGVNPPTIAEAWYATDNPV